MKVNEVHSRVKADVAHLKSSEKRSSALQQGIFGDQNTVHPSYGETCIDMGQRWASTEIGSAAECGSKNYEREERAVTIHRRPNGTSSEVVYASENFTALWHEANLREWEKQAEWPLTRSGACSKQAKEFAHCLRDLEKECPFVQMMHARIHRVAWRSGH